MTFSLKSEMTVLFKAWLTAMSMGVDQAVRCKNMPVQFISAVQVQLHYENILQLQVKLLVLKRHLSKSEQCVLLKCHSEY